MSAVSLPAVSRRILFGLTLGLATSRLASPAPEQAPGGFVEQAESGVVRAPWTAAQIQAFLPDRGRFTFPAPYGTDAIRLTNAADCGGADCVESAAVNFHARSDRMLVVVGLRGVGPTLISYDKVTERVERLGPLFEPDSPYASATGRGWYFSARRPTWLYLSGASGSRLERYDLRSKTLKTVFDASTQFGAGQDVVDAHSSDDDAVHSAILADAASATKLGCLTYREDTGQFGYHPARGALDQCRVDRTGRWLFVRDVDAPVGYSQRVVDLETGAETPLADEDGGGPGAFRIWVLDRTPLRAALAYRDAYFGTAGAGQVRLDGEGRAASGGEYTCGGGARTPAPGRADEIVCFHLGDPREVLVLAQVMPGAARAGGDREAARPLGGLDPTGGYFLWTSRMVASRADVFLGKVPADRIPGTPSGKSPGAEPASHSTAAGFVDAVTPPSSVGASAPDPTLLPVATTAQVPLTTAYNLLQVPSKAAGGFYLDPQTGVRIYKLTSATFPAPSARWGHDYSEGGDEVSLPYQGSTRAVLVRQAGGSWWLADFTPGAGVGNARRLTGTLAPVMDLAFTFSNNPATPYYAYVSSGSVIRRFDIRTMTEAPGSGWPVTGETSAMWLHQSENDGLFVWMRGANGSTVVGYEPSSGTRKTYTNANLNEPRIDRAGRYVGISMNTPLNGLVVWDWQTNTVPWTSPGDPGIPFAHNASLRRRWMTVDWNMSYPPDFAMFSSDVFNSGVHIGGPANGTTIHGNGSWIQHPANLNDQWALFCHYGSLRPPESYWLAPGGMVLITANGQRRLLGHPYNTTSNYTFFSFAKFSSDGNYVLFTSDMNGSGRSDVFLAEVPSASIPDTTPPTVSISAPAAGATVSGTAVAVSASATDNVGVVGVQFKLDGGLLGAEDTSAPYSVTWNTTLAANGSHTLTAVARDAAGNAKVSAPVVVTVSNALVISAVAASAVTASGATITWTTDRPSDSQVEYGLTAAYGSSTAVNTSLVHSHSLALSGLTAATLYHYRVKSRDAAGNLSVSGDFTFATLAGPAQGLVVHLKLNEGSGTVAADSSGMGHAGTLMNGAAWATGHSGQATALDGINDFVRVPHAADLNPFPLTAAVWFKTTTTAGVRGLVNKYVGGSYNGYQIFFNNGNLCAWYLRDTSNFVYDGGGCTLSTAGYNDGAWHQTVFVVDAAGGRLYVDGVQRATRSWTGLAGPPTTTQDLSLGHYPGGFQKHPYLAAVVDELRLYSRALSAAEVLQLYSAP